MNSGLFSTLVGAKISFFSSLTMDFFSPGENVELNCKKAAAERSSLSLKELHFLRGTNFKSWPMFCKRDVLKFRTMISLHVQCVRFSGIYWQDIVEIEYNIPKYVFIRV